MPAIAPQRAQPLDRSSPTRAGRKITQSIVLSRLSRNSDFVCHLSSFFFLAICLSISPSLPLFYAGFLTLVASVMAERVGWNVAQRCVFKIALQDRARPNKAESPATTQNISSHGAQNKSLFFLKKERKKGKKEMNNCLLCGLLFTKSGRESLSA